MKRRILFVDDEPNVLQGLRRSLRQMASAWEMEFAAGGHEALEKFAAAPFDVIVSDIRMPEMDGIELLRRVREQYPKTVRIALTGQTSHETALRSAGTAHQFLNKPCDPTALISSVHRACELRQVLTQESLQQLIAGITTLPSLPHVYSEIVEELQQPTASMQRIGQLVSLDIAMTAKLLQLVNSGFFGLPQRITNVSQAVVLLGAQTIKALTLTVGIFSQFQGAKTLIDALARHSILVGTYARRIAEFENMPESLRDDAFMAGVLHDLGKLILFTGFPEAYQEVMALMNAQVMDPSELERRIFGATHADVGAALLGLWAFPDPTVEAVAFHHLPSKCINSQFSPLTAVHVANVFAGPGTGNYVNTLDQAYLERLGLSQNLDTWKLFCTTSNDAPPMAAAAAQPSPRASSQ